MTLIELAAPAPGSCDGVRANPIEAGSDGRDAGPASCGAASYLQLLVYAVLWPILDAFAIRVPGISRFSDRSLSLWEEGSHAEGGLVECFRDAQRAHMQTLDPELRARNRNAGVAASRERLKGGGGWVLVVRLYGYYALSSADAEAVMQRVWAVLPRAWRGSVAVRSGSPGSAEVTLKRRVLVPTGFIVAVKALGLMSLLSAWHWARLRDVGSAPDGAPVPAAWALVAAEWWRWCYTMGDVL